MQVNTCKYHENCLPSTERVCRLFLLGFIIFCVMYLDFVSVTCSDSPPINA